MVHFTHHQHKRKKEKAIVSTIIHPMLCYLSADDRTLRLGDIAGYFFKYPQYDFKYR
jgi:hypothetical protein